MECFKLGGLWKDKDKYIHLITFFSLKENDFIFPIHHQL